METLQRRVRDALILRLIQDRGVSAEDGYLCSYLGAQELARQAFERGLEAGNEACALPLFLLTEARSDALYARALEIFEELSGRYRRAFGRMAFLVFWLRDQELDLANRLATELLLRDPSLPLFIPQPESLAESRREALERVIDSNFHALVEGECWCEALDRLSLRILLTGSLPVGLAQPEGAPSLTLLLWFLEQDQAIEPSWLVEQADALGEKGEALALRVAAAELLVRRQPLEAAEQLMALAESGADELGACLRLRAQRICVRNQHYSEAADIVLRRSEYAGQGALRVALSVLHILYGRLGQLPNDGLLSSIKLLLQYTAQGEGDLSLETVLRAGELLAQHAMGLEGVEAFYRDLATGAELRHRRGLEQLMISGEPMMLTLLETLHHHTQVYPEFFAASFEYAKGRVEEGELLSHLERAEDELSELLQGLLDYLEGEGEFDYLCAELGGARWLECLRDLASSGPLAGHAALHLGFEQFLGGKREEATRALALALGELEEPSLALEVIGYLEQQGARGLRDEVRLRAEQYRLEAEPAMPEPVASERAGEERQQWYRLELERLAAREDWRGYVALGDELLGQRGEAAAKAELNASLGWVVLQVFDDPRRAQRYFEQAVQASPHEVGAWRGLADIQRESKAWRALAKSLGAIAEGSPDREEQAQVLLELARIEREKLGEFEAAERRLQQALSCGAEHERVLVELMELYVAAGSWDQAARLAADLERDPVAMAAVAGEDFWALVGRIELERGALERAQQAYERALRLAPTRREVLDEYLSLLLRRGVGEGFSRELYQRLMTLAEAPEAGAEQASAAVESLIALGLYFARMGAERGALGEVLASYEALWKIAPHSRELARLHVAFLLRVGRYREARERLLDYRGGLKRRSRQWRRSCLWGASIAIEYEENLDAAQQILEELAEVRTEYEGQALLAQVELLKGDLDSAQHTIQGVLRAYRGAVPSEMPEGTRRSASEHHRLAAILAGRIGERERALADIEMALRFVPDDVTSQEVLLRLLAMGEHEALEAKLEEVKQSQGGEARVRIAILEAELLGQFKPWHALEVLEELNRMPLSESQSVDCAQLADQLGDHPLAEAFLAQARTRMIPSAELLYGLLEHALATQHRDRAERICEVLRCLGHHRAPSCEARGGGPLLDAALPVLKLSSESTRLVQQLRKWGASWETRSEPTVLGRPAEPAERDLLDRLVEGHLAWPVGVYFSMWIEPLWRAPFVAIMPRGERLEVCLGLSGQVESVVLEALVLRAWALCTLGVAEFWHLGVEGVVQALEGQGRVTGQGMEGQLTELWHEVEVLVSHRILAQCGLEQALAGLLEGGPYGGQSADWEESSRARHLIWRYIDGGEPNSNR